MNLFRLTNALALGLVLTVAVAGCKKRPTPLTVIPGSPGKSGVATPPTNPMVNSEGGTRLPGGDGGNVGSTPVKPATDTTGGVGFTGPGHEGWTPNAEIFKQYTVYFDFDSSAIRGGERTKVGSIADYLKSNAAHAVKIEGHCDERGTEEYNRALGERRALALREELVKLGIDPTRLDTVSFGKDRPAVQGQNEDAWSKNRRGEFVLLTPPAAP